MSFKAGTTPEALAMPLLGNKGRFTTLHLYVQIEGMESRVMRGDTNE
jgi:hypothetical protein